MKKKSVKILLELKKYLILFIKNNDAKLTLRFYSMNLNKNEKIVF
jgi:hypothetical protein